MGMETHEGLMATSSLSNGVKIWKIDKATCVP